MEEIVETSMSQLAERAGALLMRTAQQPAEQVLGVGRPAGHERQINGEWQLGSEVADRVAVMGEDPRSPGPQTISHESSLAVTSSAPPSSAAIMTVSSSPSART